MRPATDLAALEQLLQALGEQRDLRARRSKHPLGEEPDHDREARDTAALVELLHDDPVEAPVPVDARLHERLADQDDAGVFDLFEQIGGDVLAAARLEQAAAVVRPPHAEAGAGADLQLGLAVHLVEPVGAHAHQHEAALGDPVEEAAHPRRPLLSPLDGRARELEVGDQLADRQHHAAVVGHHVGHPAHHLEEALPQVLAGGGVLEGRSDLGIEVRLEGDAVGRLDDPGQVPRLVPLGRVLRGHDEPLLRAPASQLEPKAVDDEGTIVLQDLDDRAAGPIVGVAHTHPQLVGRARGDPIEGLDRHRGEQRLPAGLVGVDPTHQARHEALEKLAPAGLDAAGGSLDQVLERVGRRSHAPSYPPGRRVLWRRAERSS